MAPNRPTQQLISNPVFHSVQPAVQEGAETKSEILYANRFSGLPEVPMQNELLEVFSDKGITLTDTSLYLQLSNLLNDFDAENGPWYIEGKSGVIHIHNRKISQSAFVYRYQDENGEVLKVQITTNWTVSTTSGTVASAIGANKVRDITRLDLPGLDFSEKPSIEGVRKLRPFVIWEPQDNTRMAGSEPSWETIQRDNEGRVIYQTVETNAYRASQAQNFGAELIPQPTPDGRFFLENMRIQQEIKARAGRHGALLADPNKSHADFVSHIDSWAAAQDNAGAGERADSLYTRILDNFVKQYGGGSEQVGNYVRQTYDKFVKSGGKVEVLSPAELQLMNSRGWLDDPEYAAELSTERVLTQTYEFQREQGYNYGTVASSGSSTPTGKPGTVITALTIDELSDKLAAAGVGYNTTHTAAFSPTSHGKTSAFDIIKEARNALKSQQDRGGGVMVTGVGSIKVTIGEGGKYTVEVTTVGRYPGEFSLMEAANSQIRRDDPTSGTSKKARAMALLNRIKNRARKVKQKMIEVTMVVIGRPSLEAGQYLEILNIGQKYSGQWYIKTCIHQLDSNGYTCSLTLKRNQVNQDGKITQASRKKSGATSGKRYPFTTPDGTITLDLSAYDADYAKRLVLENRQRSLERFIGTALVAQASGTYGEGLKAPTNIQDVHMDGTENPDLTYADTPAGQAATQAYNAEVERRRAEIAAAKAKQAAKKPSPRNIKK